MMLVPSVMRGPRFVSGGYRTLGLALRFAGGAVGSDDASYGHRGAHVQEYSGTRGRVLAEDTVRRSSFQAVGSKTGEVWEAGYFAGTDRALHQTFDAHLAAGIAAFRADSRPPGPRRRRPAGPGPGPGGGRGIRARPTGNGSRGPIVEEAGPWRTGW